MGERPAIVHLKDFRLAGMTTGSGCIAPKTCRAFFDACRRGDWLDAERLRADFMPLEDIRDALGPARVLHHATEAAGIAPTGSIPPYISPLGEGHLMKLTPVARELKERAIRDEAAQTPRGTPQPSLVRARRLSDSWGT